MAMQTISTKELRENFRRVKQAMDKGQSLLLLYRSQPLAKIKPVTPTRPKLRQFSLTQLKDWIKADRLTKTQQGKIDQIISRLP